MWLDGVCVCVRRYRQRQRQVSDSVSEPAAADSVSAIRQHDYLTLQETDETAEGRGCVIGLAMSADVCSMARLLPAAFQCMTGVDT